MIMKIYYPVGPVNIHIQSLINIIQENNLVVTIKKGKGKLLLFYGKVERVITIYGDLYCTTHTCVLHGVCALDFGEIDQSPQVAEAAQESHLHVPEVLRGFVLHLRYG